ncbi:hypothetical protein SDC9_78341 [bioreactor metagenome]|uniref:Uncharacterized protein n=1 Tax=bioreactor metagenome TaxID=1076179 RepID=A0A644Z0R6_9ZZZZ
MIQRRTDGGHGYNFRQSPVPDSGGAQELDRRSRAGREAAQRKRTLPEISCFAQDFGGGSEPARSRGADRTPPRQRQFHRLCQNDYAAAALRRFLRQRPGLEQQERSAVAGRAAAGGKETESGDGIVVGCTET